MRPNSLGSAYVDTAKRVFTRFKLQQHALAAARLLLPLRGAAIRGLFKRFSLWKAVCLQPQDSFDIVPIPCPTGDLCPRGLSLEGSEIATHLVERQSEDYSGEAEMYEDVAASASGESGRVAADLSEEWQGRGLEEAAFAEDGEERSFPSDQEDPNFVNTLTLPPTWDAEDALRRASDPVEPEKRGIGQKEGTESWALELKQAEEREIKRQDEEIARLKAEQLAAELREIEKTQAEKLANDRKAAELLELERLKGLELERERKEAEDRKKQDAELRELEKQREKERLEAEQRERERVAAELREKERKNAELRERLETEQRERLETEQREKLETEKREKLEAEQRKKLETAKREKLETEQREKSEAEERDKLEAEQRKRLEAELRERLEIEIRERLEAEFRETRDLKILEGLKSDPDKAEFPSESAYFDLDYISPKASVPPQRPSLLPLRDFAVEDPLEAQLLDFYARTPDEVINSGDNSAFDLQVADSEPPNVYSHREDNAAFRTTIGSSIHQRLYEEAYKRRMLQTRYEQAKYEGDLRECTFQPGSARGVVARDVHQRLYQRAGEDRVKEQVYLRRKLEQELSGCTFTPALGHVPGKAFSPARLYEDAERKRALRDQPAAEPLARSAFSRPGSTAIYEKLYSSSTAQAAKLRKQQVEREMQATQGVTFSPRVNPHKSEPAALPAHERLYLLNEEMLKRLESKRMAQRPDSAVRREGREEEPRYEALYMDGAKRQRKQAALQAKVDFELGINFMPRTNLHAAHPSA